MNAQQFAEYAQQGFNRIPVSRRILADLETPVSAYMKLASGPYSYLLESVQGGEKWGRYSMIGLPCRTVFKVSANHVSVETDGVEVESYHSDEPLDAVSEFQQRYRAPEIEGLPKFNGGLVGFFAYDSVRYVEKKLAHSTPQDDLGTPDIVLTLSEEILVFDNLAGAIYLIVMADPAQADAYQNAQQRLQDLVEQLPQKQGLKPLVLHENAAENLSEDEFERGFEQPDFEAAVETIKQYILAGDAMQVVVSQRLSTKFTAPPLDLYRALRSLNPSPYMYFLDMGDFHIVGASPEILARSEDGVVTVRPIAGTRRRGHDEAEDVALEQELLADPKEIAEHLMLIDLGRNDAGRIAKVGTVDVSDKMIIERYSHVMHIVSSVQAQLKDGLNAMDVLKATLPAGTLSGAPKVRAMEIIDELEPVKRGVYGGAIGYISWNGNMDTAIAIRTAVVKDQRLYIQAGAGVVADSIPALEWKETMNKARAVMRAAGMVQFNTEHPNDNGEED